MTEIEVEFLGMVDRGPSTTPRALFDVHVDGDPLGRIRGGVATSLWPQTGVDDANAEAVLRAYLPGRIRRLVEDDEWDDLQDFEDGKLRDAHIFNTDPAELREVVEQPS